GAATHVRDWTACAGGEVSAGLGDAGNDWFERPFGRKRCLDRARNANQFGSCDGRRVGHPRVAGAVDRNVMRGAKVCARRFQVYRRRGTGLQFRNAPTRVDYPHVVSAVHRKTPWSAEGSGWQVAVGEIVDQASGRYLSNRGTIRVGDPGIARTIERNADRTLKVGARGIRVGEILYRNAIGAEFRNTRIAGVGRPD